MTQAKIVAASGERRDLGVAYQVVSGVHLPSERGITDQRNHTVIAYRSKAWRGAASAVPRRFFHGTCEVIAHPACYPSARREMSPRASCNGHSPSPATGTACPEGTVVGRVDSHLCSHHDRRQ